MRSAATLACAATGEWIAARAGTMNISLEGMILTSAFTSARASDLAGNVWMALLFGVLGGLLVAAIEGVMSHRFGANQFVVGLTLNVLAVGLTAFVAAEVDPVVTRAGTIRIPLLSRIPLIGEALFAQS